ncbi:MAG: RagB/SusD family nutrient uptake outer membrane protein, partial [Tannerella sp.]|nr:RagB/SusD family nutrient uptake outer membrane protein [Tannerella sp.]
MKTLIKRISKKRMICLIACLWLCNACSDYLNVVPDDGIPTLDNAFAMRSEAERYLFTCYSYMPRDGSLPNDPAIMGGDEFWSIIDPPSNYTFGDAMFRIARGLQNATSPFAGEYWTSLYKGLRVCNIFLENIDKV